jgi:hypothetical protein
MKAVAEHLRACPSCTGLLTELRVVDALLATTSPRELAPNFTFAVMAEVRNTPKHAHRSTPVWGALALYLGAAWVALCAFAFIAGRAPWLAALWSATRNGAANAFAAIAGAAHGVAPAGPTVVAIVCVVLLLDAMLALAIFTYYRTILPRLAERLARSEAS